MMMMMKAMLVCICYMNALCPVVNSVGNNNNTNSVNCSLYANVSDVKILQRAFDSHKLFLRLTVSIAGDSGTFLEPTQGKLIRTDAWILAIGDTGKSFLHVHEGFELMSLYTMSFSVQNAIIQLYQSSDSCLQNLTLGEIETKVRTYFLNLLDVPLTTDINVCSRRIIQGSYDYFKDAYIGNIEFSCCVQDFSGRMSCENLKPGVWFNILMPLRVFTSFALFLILGTLLPPWKEKKNSYSKFLEYIFLNQNWKNSYRCILSSPMRINIFFSHYVDSSGKYPKQKGYKQLNETLNGISQSQVSTYQLEVDAISVSVEETFDITDGIPVPGFFQYLLDVIKFLIHKMNKKNTYDGKVITISLTFFIGIIVIFPIIIRVIFYFIIEKPLLDTYNDLANKRGYTNVSLIELNTNIVLIVFDIIAICLLLLHTFSYKYISRKFNLSWERYESFKENFKGRLNVLGKLRNVPIFCCCIRRFLSDNDSCDCFGNSVIFKTFINLPFLLLYILALICVQSPTICKILFLSRTVYKNAYKKEKIKFILCFLLIYAYVTVLLVFLFDVIIFYVYCLTYVVIGILLNYDQVASYVSFVIVFIFYCTISIISAKKPLTFFNQIFINTLNEYCDKITDFDSFKRVYGYSKACLCSRSNGLGFYLGSPNSVLKWVVPSELLFFDFSDDVNYSSHVSKTVISKMLYSEHQFSPKRNLYLIYLIALRNIFFALVIFGFLLAITLAVSGGSSPGIITLFSFVSGFSVVSIKKLCYKSPTNKDIDQWKALFEKNMNSKDILDVSDIHVSKVHALNNLAIEDGNDIKHLYIKEIRDTTGRKLYNFISHME